MFDMDYAMGSAGWNRNRRVVAVAQSRLVKGLKGEIAGAGQFVAAYLVKEAVKAIETRDLEQMKEATRQLKEPFFWGSLGAFTGAAKLTEVGIRFVQGGRLVRAALPLAAGMAAVQLLSGQVSLKGLAISTGSYLVAGIGVGLLADAVVYPMLFAAGPPGWIGAGLYSIGKMAVTLVIGEKLDRWLRGLFEEGEDRVERSRQTPAYRSGVQERIEEVGRRAGS